MEPKYTGYKKLYLSDSKLSKLYEGKYEELELLDNEYLVALDENDMIVDSWIKDGDFLKQVKYLTIKTRLDGELKPRNIEQKLLFHLLQDDKTKIKLVTGPFGTGKSMLMIAQALSMLESGAVDKMVYVRNNIELKDTGTLGALPGDELTKLRPYMGVLIDHLGSDFILDKYISNGTIEPTHLGYMRGRDIKNSVVYVTEAQNLTVDQMQLLIGRIGENSVLFLDGDIKQIDRKVFCDRNNGINAIIDCLKGNEYFGYVHLVKCERSPVAALADKLDEYKERSNV